MDVSEIGERRERARREALGAALSAAREEMSVQELAEVTGIDVGHIEGWENGEGPGPCLEELHRMELATGVTAGSTAIVAGYVSENAMAAHGYLRRLVDLENEASIVRERERTPIVSLCEYTPEAASVAMQAAQDLSLHVRVETDEVFDADDGTTSWEWRIEVFSEPLSPERFDGQL